MRIDPIDIHVGKRLRMRRRIMQMSLSQLGAAVGLSLKQIQKYEIAQNRVSPGRLQQIAMVLNVPASFFFEGAEGATINGVGSRESDWVADFLNTAGGLKLAKAFSAISDQTTRWMLANLVAAIADSEDASTA